MELSPRISQAAEQVREQLLSIPGVQGATASFLPPFVGARFYNIAIDGREAAPPNAQGQGAQGPGGNWLAVMNGYFETLGVQSVRGRILESRDTAASAPVVVINQTMAKKFWPNEDPIGKRFKVDYYNDPIREIVGIVPDLKLNLREREPAAIMYVPYAQLPTIQESQTAVNLHAITFIVRAGEDNLGTVVSGMTAAARRVVPALAVANVRTVAEFAYFSTFDQWVYSTLLTIFGTIAVLLAVAGIYGVMAHSVAQRTGEIGVRVALGASGKDVLQLVLRRGVFLIAFGMLIGAAVSFAMNRAIQSVLWGVTPTDPVTYALALGALAGVALLACYIPARRALRIDPVVALRIE
jgi:predicted permease